PQGQRATGPHHHRRRRVRRDADERRGLVQHARVVQVTHQRQQRDHERQQRRRLPHHRQAALRARQRQQRRGQQQQRDGGVGGHAVGQAARLGRGEVVRQQLIQAQVDAGHILEQRGYRDQRRDGRQRARHRHVARTAPQQQQSGGQQRHARGGVGLHAEAQP